MPDRLPPGIIEVVPGTGYPGDPTDKDHEPFKGPIFFGSETCTKEVTRAHGQLDLAFEHMSGLQQPCHCDHPDCGCEEQNKQGWATVQGLARSLVTAMGCEDMLRDNPAPEVSQHKMRLMQRILRRLIEGELILKGDGWELDLPNRVIVKGPDLDDIFRAMGLDEEADLLQEVKNQ